VSAGDGFRAFVGADVVVDTSTSYVFIGRLVEVTDHVLALQDADVHDRSESRTTKEKYVMEARKSGVRMNRKAVTVRLETVVCVSRLEDVVEY
jgi:hypothetical protein